jgi:hypothetical protein
LLPKSTADRTQQRQTQRGATFIWRQQTQPFKLVEYGLKHCSATLISFLSVAISAISTMSQERLPNQVCLILLLLLRLFFWHFCTPCCLEVQASLVILRPPPGHI